MENKIQKYQTQSEIARYGETHKSLTNPPIKVSIQEKGLEVVKGMICVYIQKCAISLQIDLSDMQINTLYDDIKEVYEWESLEDIESAFKRGRRGEFGTTFNKLNMIVFKEWMQVVLEDKAVLREKAKNNEKKQLTEQLPNVDYAAYKEREKKKQEEEEKPPLSHMQYEAMKHDYFNKNKNDG